LDPKTRTRKPAATDMPDQLEPENDPEYHQPGWQMPRQENLVLLED
jgi:hypothetical protein